MKAYVVNKYIKSLDELPSLLVDTPDPQPKKDEVLIEVLASGLNFFDVLFVLAAQVVCISPLTLVFLSTGKHKANSQ